MFQESGHHWEERCKGKAPGTSPVKGEGPGIGGGVFFFFFFNGIKMKRICPCPHMNWPLLSSHPVREGAGSQIPCDPWGDSFNGAPVCQVKP